MNKAMVTWEVIHEALTEARRMFLATPPRHRGPRCQYCIHDEIVSLRHQRAESTAVMERKWIDQGGSAGALKGWLDAAASHLEVYR